MMRAGRIHRQQGLSLIELMIALVIGLLLTAAIVQMFVGSRVTYSMQSELAKLQENARFAIDFISKDLRMAGYTGCKRFGSVTNVLSSEGVSPYSGDEWNESLDFTDGGDPEDPAELPPSDQINVKYLDPDTTCSVDEAKNDAENFYCEANHTFSQGEILVVSDCSHMAIFQMTNSNINLNIDGITHSTGGLTVPGNCVEGLAPESDCSSASDVEYREWSDNTIIQRFLAYTYLVKENDFDQPALFRSSLSTTADSIGMTAQELVEGVENMQMSLGFDTDDDGSADCYSNAALSCGSSMDDVVAVRVSLLMRSIEANITPDAQTYVFNGTTFSATDGRLRKVFTATITLRNLVI